MTLKIQVIAGDRHKNVAGLSPVYTIEVFHQKLVTEQITYMDSLRIIDCEEQISKLIEILNNSADKC
jgi:hypothetical protein